MDCLASLCCWLTAETTNDGLSEASPLLESSNLLQYKYQPLATDEIRLLILHPAKSFEDDIIIHLQVLKRSDEQYYEAVSYAWGADELTVPLLVHDEQHAESFLHGQNIIKKVYRYQSLKGHPQDFLRVRANVAMMLRYLRYPWLPRYLWIDQICINQMDNQEKNHQVNQMGEIYKRSRRTLIWLGCSKIYSKPLSALEATLRQTRTEWSWDLDGYVLGEEDGDGDYKRLRPEVRRILSLPWFQRRWVIQEVALSSRPRVIFGHDEMSFEDMTYFIDQLRKRSYDIPPHIAESIHVLEMMTSLFRRGRFRGASLATNVKYDVFRQYYRHHPKSNDAVDFIQLLVSMHSARCSDDRDRVYALNNLRRDPIVVDYRRSTEEVFSTFAITECNHSLETLYCSGAFPSHALPSWVPDWRSPRRWIPVKSFEDRPPSLQLLSDSPRVPTPLSQNPKFIDSKSLVVNATTLTFVAFKGPQLYENWTFNPWLCLAKYLEFFARSTSSTTYPMDLHNTHFLDLLMSTLTAGAIESGANLKDWLEVYDSAQSYKRTRKEYLDPCCECHNKSICKYPSAHSNNFNVLERIEHILRGRCVFVTERGDWALGPASLLSGDVIIALPGCRYPFVMRPKGASTFTIIGDCYFTLMEGSGQLFNPDSCRVISIV